jgi:TRAP-type mannitol/chloroaromatic compound transport system permease small subunit
MGPLLGVARVIDAVTGAIGRAMWWVSLFMVIVGVYNVATRYFYGPLERLVGIQAAERMTGNTYLELQTYSFDLIFLLAAAYVFRIDGHVRVDILFSNYSQRAKALTDLIGIWLFLVPFSIMGIIFTVPYVQRSWQTLEMSPNPGGLPRYPIKAAIIVAFALLLLQAISLTIRHIAFLRGHPKSGSIYATPPATEVPATVPTSDGTGLGV